MDLTLIPQFAEHGNWIVQAGHYVIHMEIFLFNHGKGND